MSRSLARALLLVVAIVAGCGSGSASDPAGVVRQAFTLLDQGNIDGVIALTCDAQKSAIRQQFDLAGSLGGVAAGIDVNQIIQAMNIDASQLGITQTSASGDKGTVQVVGQMKISFDGPRLRDVFKKMAEQRGQPADDAMLDGLVSTVSAMSQSVPINQTVEVVREGGAWKLCSPLTLMN